MSFGTPLFRFKQGDHCCVFYEDDSALLDVLVPFFAEGLQKNERCFAAQTDSVAAALVSGLRSRGINTDRAIARGALNIVTLSEFYGKGAQAFDPTALIGSLMDFVAESLRRGFSGSRTAGEMQFIVHDEVEFNQLLEYEQLVDATFPGKTVLGICQYDTRLFTREMLERAVAVHRQCMSEIHPEISHASMAIRRGRYVLDIITDRRRPGNGFYYVAQEHGKNEILGWGVEPNFDAAMLEGESLIRGLSS